jgi:hypothetical protein
MTRRRWTPTLVLCSRNARPEKGLVRRPHVDQHGCPSQKGKAGEPGRILKKYGGRSLRAVKDNSAIPLGGSSTIATPSISIPSTPAGMDGESEHLGPLLVEEMCGLTEIFIDD